jgi:hypothetical protein
MDRLANNQMQRTSPGVDRRLAADLGVVRTLEP